MLRCAICHFIFCSLTAPEPDPQLQEVIYERTWEQNEELGLNDMKTENYSDQPKELRFDRNQNNGLKLDRIRSIRKPQNSERWKPWWKKEALKPLNCVNQWNDVLFNFLFTIFHFRN